MVGGSDCSCPAGNAPRPAFQSTPHRLHILTFLSAIVQIGQWSLAGPVHVPNLSPQWSFFERLSGEKHSGTAWSLSCGFRGSVSKLSLSPESPEEDAGGGGVDKEGSIDHTETVSCLVLGLWLRLGSGYGGRQDSDDREERPLSSLSQ